MNSRVHGLIRGVIAATAMAAWLAACDKPAAEVEPMPVGGDCSSLGGEPCECFDGSKSCTDHDGVCLCEGVPPGGVVPKEPVPVPDVTKPPDLPAEGAQPAAPTD